MKKKCKGMETRLKNGDDQIMNLQRKLDQFWERQELEKQSAKLIQKYECDKESSKTISVLTEKVFDLEK